MPTDTKTQQKGQEGAVDTAQNTSLVPSTAETHIVVRQVVGAPQYQMGLFNTDKFLNSPKVARTFGVKAILDKDGDTVGFRAGMAKRSDLATELDLKGKKNKDKLDKVIQAGQEALFEQVKAWMVLQKSGTVGVIGYAHRMGSDGLATLNVRFKQLPMQVQVDLQKLADAHGIPMSELAAFLESKKQKKAIDVDASQTGTTK
jgi:hypothetical protein